MDYSAKQVIWAKVKGYSWWPAQVTKLPTKDTEFYRVEFIGEDSHAFLNPRDVKKYKENYEEYCNKKSKKLQNAIKAADQLIKIREKQRQIIKQKSKKNNVKVTKESNVHNTEKVQQIMQNQNYEESAGLINQQSSEQIQQEQQIATPNITQEFQSTQKQNSQNPIDRQKIDKIQTQLLNFISIINEMTNQSNIDSLTVYINNFNIDYLSVQQLTQSKITNMFSYLYEHINIEPLKLIIMNLAKILKTKIIQYLTNTDYYDCLIKQIHRAKNHRADFEKCIIRILRKNYSVKKQLAQLFAEKIGSGIGSCPQLQKIFITELKDKKLEGCIQNMSSKIAVDRAVEQIIAKYE